MSAAVASAAGAAHEPSRGEWVLWQALRCSQLGVSFRRHDTRRDRVLAAAGYRVLRVAEHQVLSALPHVLARIREAIEEVE